jgi:hypothetical protein
MMRPQLNGGTLGRRVMASGQSADQVWPITVWKLESGFFARDRELAAAMQTHQFSTRVVPDIDEATQFFRVRADTRDSSSPPGEILQLKATAVSRALPNKLLKLSAAPRRDLLPPPSRP